MFTLATLGVAQGFYISGRCPEGRIGLKACKIKNLRVTLRVVIGEKAGYANVLGVSLRAVIGEKASYAKAFGVALRVVIRLKACVILA